MHQSNSLSLNPALAKSASAPRTKRAAETKPVGDSQTVLRGIDRSRSQQPRQAMRLPASFIELSTYSSFRLDGMQLRREDVTSALHPGKGARNFRSRIGQRLRNHAANSYAAESLLRAGRPLTVDIAMRWYTSISSGLCMNTLACSKIARFEEIVRRTNLPNPRLNLAIDEAAALHSEILADALVPSFNGLLARLVLHYHLGRCGLPPVIFAPDDDAKLLQSAGYVARVLPLLISQSYSALSAQR